jgi:hypothetical protein
MQAALTMGAGGGNIHHLFPPRRGEARGQADPASGPDGGEEMALPARTGHDSIEAKRSLWTVVGASASSLLVAGLVAAASGVAQIPATINEVTRLTARTERLSEDLTNANRAISVLQTEKAALERQVALNGTRTDTLGGVVERLQSETRAADLTLQKTAIETEGRSANRNTEVKGMINELKTEVQSLAERQRLQAESLRAVQGGILDLATRPGRPQGGSVQPQSGRTPQSLSPAWPPPAYEFGHLEAHASGHNE